MLLMWRLTAAIAAAAITVTAGGCSASDDTAPVNASGVSTVLIRVTPSTAATVPPSSASRTVAPAPDPEKVAEFVGEYRGRFPNLSSLIDRYIGYVFSAGCSAIRSGKGDEATLKKVLGRRVDQLTVAATPEQLAEMSQLVRQYCRT